MVIVASSLLSFTYGEFPLESTDCLIDAAHPYVEQQSVKGGGEGVDFVDMGSRCGCGRLCLYLVMTCLGGEFRSVRGIEIGKVLHQEAVRARDGAVEGGWLKRGIHATK